MKKTRLFIIAACTILMAGLAVSCDKKDSGTDTPETVLESQIVGKWIITEKDGAQIETNNATVYTFLGDGNCTISLNCLKKKGGRLVTKNKQKCRYTQEGNVLTVETDDTEGTNKTVFAITEIKDKAFTATVTRTTLTDGDPMERTSKETLSKIDVDFSLDIKGLWEGTGLTGDVTYGDSNHRWEFFSDGSYCYQVKDSITGHWVPSNNVWNQYFIDGAWLACCWKDDVNSDGFYENWDAGISENRMVWSALRENGQFTTIAMHRIPYPSQATIGKNLTGKWKNIILNGNPVPTDSRAISTYDGNGKLTTSVSTYTIDSIPNFLYEMESGYSLAGNVISIKNDDSKFTISSEILISEMNDSTFTGRRKTMLPIGDTKFFTQTYEIYQKVTADYSQAIIGLWEGISSDGKETYGDFDHRWEYLADGTYRYYSKNDAGEWEVADDGQYFVDGDWFASKWDIDGHTYNEWWDIERCDDIMEWSAVRYSYKPGETTPEIGHSTFTMKRIK